MLKRLTMRPNGVVSKKYIGAWTMLLRSRQCSVVEARMVPRTMEIQPTHTKKACVMPMTK